MLPSAVSYSTRACTGTALPLLFFTLRLTMPDSFELLFVSEILCVNVSPSTLHTA